MWWHRTPGMRLPTSACTGHTCWWLQQEAGKRDHALERGSVNYLSGSHCSNHAAGLLLTAACWATVPAAVARADRLLPMAACCCTSSAGPDQG